MTSLATDVRVINRRRWCTHVLVDFSVIIQKEDAVKWRDVARFSVAHSNYHVIQYTWDPRHRGFYKTVTTIDRVEQVTEAYQSALHHAYSDLEGFLERWRTRRQP